MSPDPLSPRLQSIFECARNLRAEEVPGYLDEACRGEPELRGRVEALLAADRAADGLLDVPAGLYVAAWQHDLDAEAVATRARTEADPPTPTAADLLAFAPGTVLGGRYRIVALVGQGGMGEVYRADDLRLGQPVALKFLSTELVRDPHALQRFHAEVRHARGVSHPNVCRVHDIGEVGGRPFLSMEYVDGEDLKSLLRRIGRLPSAKALELGRQLCAGLGAAHETGLLHRDLKPANVMVDGRGRARITDFGLAAEADPAGASVDWAGTPAYMAPERLQGRPATVQSDLYSLGLILYEMFTGVRPFETAHPGEGRDGHASQPTKPSVYATDMDASVERVILRCLERDSAQRPASVGQVVAVLPGADPLAAAIAAGETPSPEMVAAAGEEGTLSRRTAWLLLGAVAVGLAIVLALSARTNLAALSPPGLSPEVLQARAREILRDLGYAEAPADSWWDLGSDLYHRRHLGRLPPSQRRFADLDDAGLGPMVFWYRQSPRLLTPHNFQGFVSSLDPAPTHSGEAWVRLDTRGRLRVLTVRPPRRDGPARGSQPDWSRLFAAAGLDANSFQPVVPRWVPPVAFDAWAAWEGPVGGETVRLEAAAFRGQPVHFRFITPWEEPALRGQSARTATLAFQAALLPIFVVVMTLTYSLLARRNLRAGRGDRKGATRIATVVLVGHAIAFAFGRHWALDADYLWAAYLTGLGIPLFNAASAWLCYVGIEPLVRRKWPHLLIGWARLLEGKWRDPLVGRAALLGVLGGIAVVVLQNAPGAALEAFDLPGMNLRPATGLGRLGEFLWFLSSWAGTTLLWSVGSASLLVLLTLVLRKAGLAFVGVGVFFTVMLLQGEGALAVRLPAAIGMVVVFTTMIRRAGLLAFAFLWLTTGWLSFSSLTVDPARWYFGRTLVVVALVAALALYGFRTALGKYPALPPSALEP